MLQLEALADRQRPEMDQLAGMGAENGGAEDAPVASGNHLDQPLGRAFGLGAVVGGERKPRHCDAVAVLPARIGLGQAGLCQFRIGVGDPGQRRVIDLGRQPEQRVADHDAGLIAGDMGETRPTGHVTDRKDARGIGAQAPVDCDAVRPVRDPHLFEVESSDPRLAAGGDQQMRALDAGLLSLDRQRHAGRAVLGRGDFRALVQRDPFGFEHVDQ